MIIYRDIFQSVDWVHLLFSCRGRINRPMFWGYQFLYFWLGMPFVYVCIASTYLLVNTPMSYIDKVDIDELIPVFGFTIALWIYSLLAIYSQISVCVKRLHDRSKSGWSLLWCIVLGILGHAVCLLWQNWQVSPMSQINPIEPLDFIPNHIYAILVWTFVFSVFYIVIACGCRRGTEGKNKYGRDPSVNL